MRPTLVLGFIATVATAVTLGAPAGADNSPPPPQIAVAGGTITVTAQGSTHVNSGFPWYFKDGSGKKVKQVADFAFSGGASGAPVVAKVSGVPASGTLRGGYCLDSGCYTFVASCTASSCTITGT
jgi:hypothetical protein